MSNESEPSTSGPTLRARLRWGVPLLLLLAVLAFFGETLFTGRVPALRDLVCDFVPWREYAAQALGDGRFPLWSHESRCGQPFLANPQSAVLYPPHLVFLLLPAAGALTVSLALHTLLLLGGGYALARRWGLERAPALLAAAGFGFGTYTVAMMEFLTSFTTVAWLPVIWLTVDALVRAAADAGDPEGPGGSRRHLRCVRPGALLAGLFAVQALAGHTQSMLQCLVLVIAYTVVRAASEARRGTVWLALGGVGAAGLLALGLAAPQILPTWELLPLSARAEGIDLGTREASVHPSHVLTLLLPGLFGGPGYAGEWWNGEVYEYWASTSYVGVAPLVLASFLPLYWLRPGAARPLRALVVLFGCVAVAGLVLASGSRTPVYELIFENVPLLDRFRWPGKLLHWVAFSLPLLGALGFHAALRARARWLYGVAAGWGAVWLGVLALRATGMPLPDGGDPAVVGRSATWLLVVLAASVAGVALLARAGRPRAVGIALLAVTALADPAVVSRGTLPFLEPGVYTSAPDWLDEYRAAPPGRVHGIYQKSQVLLYGTRDDSLLRWARDAAVGETLLPERVHRTWGFGQLPLQRWREAWELLDDPATDAGTRQRLADVLNVRFVIHGARFDETTLREGAWPTLRWAEQRDCLPRAFIAGDWDVATDPVDARDRLLRGVPAVLHAEDGVAAPEPPREPGGPLPGAVRSIEYGWNTVSLDVVTGRPGLLVLADTWHPGWTARVDGREAEVLRANWLFRGVLVPAGAERVEMVYEDPAFTRGWIAALVSALVLVVLLLLARGAGRRRQAARG